MLPNQIEKNVLYFSDLPSKAQQFINQHFNGIEVISVVADEV